MSGIYGSNMNADVRHQKNFRSFERGEKKVWWCPACSVAVVAVKDPIECVTCDGEMTIAPASVRKRMGK